METVNNKLQSIAKDNARTKGSFTFQSRSKKLIFIGELAYGNYSKIESDGCCAKVSAGIFFSVTGKGPPIPALLGARFVGTVQASGSLFYRYCWHDSKKESDGTVNIQMSAGIRWELNIVAAKGGVEAGFVLGNRWTVKNGWETPKVSGYAKAWVEYGLFVQERYQYQVTIGSGDDVY